jgi:hypothetical protein
VRGGITIIIPVFSKFFDVFLIFSSLLASVAEPDAGSGDFLTPGSGMGKKYGSGMNIPDNIFESLERNNVLG